MCQDAIRQNGHQTAVVSIAVLKRGAREVWRGKVIKAGRYNGTHNQHEPILVQNQTHSNHSNIPHSVRMIALLRLSVQVHKQHACFSSAVANMLQQLTRLFLTC
jgi:hypothetical protein